MTSSNKNEHGLKSYEELFNFHKHLNYSVLNKKLMTVVDEKYRLMVNSFFSVSKYIATSVADLLTLTHGKITVTGQDNEAEVVL